MRQPGMMMVDVGPGETTAQLLDQLNTVPAGTHLLLRLPKDARALRELDDFNNLRQVAATRQLHLVISSPEKTIVGLARLLGFEVDGRPAGIGTGNGTPTATETPPAPTTRPTADVPVAAAPAAPPPVAPPPPAPPAAVSIAPATPMSENDWLFGAGLDAVPDEHVEAAGGMAARQPTPPPDVHIVGGLAAPTAPRPAASGEFDDIDAMNFDDDELER